MMARELAEAAGETQGEGGAAGKEGETERRGGGDGSAGREEELEGGVGRGWKGLVAREGGRCFTGEHAAHVAEVLDATSVASARFAVTCQLLLLLPLAL